MSITLSSMLSALYSPSNSTSSSGASAANRSTNADDTSLTTSSQADSTSGSAELVTLASLSATDDSGATLTYSALGVLSADRLNALSDALPGSEGRHPDMSAQTDSPAGDSQDVSAQGSSAAPDQLGTLLKANPAYASLLASNIPTQGIVDVVG